MAKILALYNRPKGDFTECLNLGKVPNLGITGINIVLLPKLGIFTGFCCTRNLGKLVLIDQPAPPLVGR